MSLREHDIPTVTPTNWTDHDVGQSAPLQVGHYHKSEAAVYLYRAQLKRGEKSRIGKPHVKVFIHNGTTVYETNNHRAAWEKRYAQYVDDNFVIVRL